jgi:hypothetical protein
MDDLLARIENTPENAVATNVAAKPGSKALN